VGNYECIQNFGRKDVKGRKHLEFIGIDGKIILKWILSKYGGRVWTGFIWLKIGTSSGFL
jgi:hypothetical protein